MAEATPIPAALWQRILLFLRHKSTGQIILHVHHGKVGSVSLNEQLRSEDPAAPAEETR